MASSCLKNTSSVFEFPYREDGSLDWNTLGKILSANILAEVLQASYVDPKHGCAKPDFKPDTDWVYDFEKEDIVVFKKPSERTFFMSRGVIDLPLQEISEYIKDIRSTFIWDSFLAEAEYLKVLTTTDKCTDYLGYQRWETTQCFTKHKRDMLYFNRCVYIDDKYVQSAISIEDEDHPIIPDIERIDARSGCGFVLEPYKGSSSKTLINYLGNVDLKVLPLFLRMRVLKLHSLNVVRTLKKFFSKRPNFTSSGAVGFNPDLEPHSQISASLSHRYEDVLPVEHFLKNIDEEETANKDSCS